MEAKLGEVISERFVSMGVAYRHFSIVTSKSVRRQEIRVTELHRGADNVSQIQARDIPNRLFAANESKPWIHLYGHQQFLARDVVRRAKAANGAVVGTYDVHTQNCEHWCSQMKTGTAASVQSDPPVDQRLGPAARRPRSRRNRRQ
jgi:hypothetical protein